MAESVRTVAFQPLASFANFHRQIERNVLTAHSGALPLYVYPKNVAGYEFRWCWPWSKYERIPYPHVFGDYSIPAHPSNLLSIHRA